MAAAAAEAAAAAAPVEAEAEAEAKARAEVVVRTEELGVTRQRSAHMSSCGRARSQGTKQTEEACELDWPSCRWLTPHLPRCRHGTGRFEAA